MGYRIGSAHTNKRQTAKSDNIFPFSLTHYKKHYFWRLFTCDKKVDF